AGGGEVESEPLPRPAHASPDWPNVIAQPIDESCHCRPVRPSVTANTSAARSITIWASWMSPKPPLYSRIAPPNRSPDHAGASVVALRLDPAAEQTFPADPFARTIT